MSNKLECMRCHALMETGFVVDNHTRRLRAADMVSRPAGAKFWMGLKPKKDKTIPVVTLRCPQCGYLESYANRR